MSYKGISIAIQADCWILLQYFLILIIVLLNGMSKKTENSKNFCLLKCLNVYC